MPEADSTNRVVAASRDLPAPPRVVTGFPEDSLSGHSLLPDPLGKSHWALRWQSLRALALDHPRTAGSRLPSPMILSPCDISISELNNFFFNNSLGCCLLSFSYYVFFTCFCYEYTFSVNFQ